MHSWTNGTTHQIGIRARKNRDVPFTIKHKARIIKGDKSIRIPMWLYRLIIRKYPDKSGRLMCIHHSHYTGQYSGQ